MEIAIRSNGGYSFGLNGWQPNLCTVFELIAISSAGQRNAEIQSEVCDIVAAHMQVGFAIVSATLLNSMKYINYTHQVHVTFETVLLKVLCCRLIA